MVYFEVSPRYPVILVIRFDGHFQGGSMFETIIICNYAVHGNFEGDHAIHLLFCFPTNVIFVFREIHV